MQPCPTVSQSDAGLTLFDVYSSFEDPQKALDELKKVLELSEVFRK